MRRIDLTIGAVIVSALILSGVGLATYERDVTTLSDFVIAWTETGQATPAGAAKTLNGNGLMEWPFTLNYANLTVVTLTFTASAGATPPRLSATSVVARVEGPGLQAKSVTGSIPATTPNAANGVTLRVEVPVALVPNATAVQANTTAEAQENVAKNNTSLRGRGPWKASLQFTQVLSGNTGQPGLTFTGSQTGEWKSYSALVSPKQPVIQK